MEIINQSIHSPKEEKKYLIIRPKEDFLSPGEEYEAQLLKCVDEINIEVIVNMAKESKDVTPGRSPFDVTS